MRIGLRFLVPALALLVASASSGQPLRAGILSNGDTTAVSGQVTVVDLSYPVTEDGVLTTATVMWQAGNGAPCSQAMKIKVFRFLGDNSVDFIDERGPFDVTPGIVTVTLDPPIPVEKGDLIAASQLAAPPCGAVQLASETAGYHMVSISGDVSEEFSIGDTQASLFEEVPMIEASGQAEVYAGTVPAAGSAHSPSGTAFRTAIQLFNPGTAAIRGRLVFHPMGVSGSATDPSISYDLAPGATAHFDDLVSAAGTTGLGSLDVLTQSSPPPLVVSRLFNDNGSGGTNGFSEPFIRPGDPTILRSENSQFELGDFVAPTDTAEFRVNFGIRAFRDGVTLSVFVTGPSGQQVSFVTRHYGPNVFEQLSAKAFTGIDLPAGASVTVQVTEGSAVVYMVTVDNKTDDTAMQIGDRRRP
ncbi:MAG TPA: hypothetical protein VFS34_10910 [Thermoanaerobaculia bacterium]|nr:hypothetical protein [Thermoanaerobaculia bacterium]